MDSHLSAFSYLKKSVLNSNNENAIVHPDFPKMLETLLFNWSTAGNKTPDNYFDQVTWFLVHFSSWTEDVRVPLITGEHRNCIFVYGISGCKCWTGTGFLDC
jgi:hypothetical protein